MTVIAYTDGMMAADSMAVVGGRKDPAGHPKITRGPDGSLAGAAGDAAHCYAFSRWFAAGENPDSRPKWTGDKDDYPTILIARPDGTLWRQDGDDELHPVKAPYAIGEPAATNFCSGMMAAGVDAFTAVHIAVQRCIWIGGPVQVEQMELPKSEPFNLAG